MVSLLQQPVLETALSSGDRSEIIFDPQCPDASPSLRFTSGSNPTITRGGYLAASTMPARRGSEGVAQIEVGVVHSVPGKNREKTSVPHAYFLGSPAMGLPTNDVTPECRPDRETDAILSLNHGEYWSHLARNLIVDFSRDDPGGHEYPQPRHLVFLPRTNVKARSASGMLE